MTMKTNKFLAIAAVAVAMTACSNDENGKSTPKYIQISAGIPTATRTVVTADGNLNFASGDAISVYAWTGSSSALPTNVSDYVVNGSTNTYDGTKWTASPQMLWKNLTDPHFFLAVYPKRQITDVNYTFDAADAEKSDVLVAHNMGVNNAGVVATEELIPLTFDHVMANLQVNLQFRNQWGANGPSNLAMKTSVQTEGTIDFMAKTMTSKGSNTEVKLNQITTPASGYAASFETLIVPQSGFKSLTINVEGNDYVFTNPTDIKLQSGKTTIVNLIVGRNEIEVGNISISSWTTGTTIGGDNPVEVTD